MVSHLLTFSDAATKIYLVHVSKQEPVDYMIADIDTEHIFVKPELMDRIKVRTEFDGFSNWSSSSRTERATRR